MISICFAYGFIRAYKMDKGILIPERIWSVGKGVTLGCEVYRIPLSTGSGGTVQGYPSLWLVVIDVSGKKSRLAKVYQEIDLLDINLAMGIDQKDQD